MSFWGVEGVLGGCRRRFRGGVGGVGGGSKEFWEGEGVLGGSEEFRGGCRRSFRGGHRNGHRN